MGGGSPEEVREKPPPMIYFANCTLVFLIYEKIDPVGEKYFYVVLPFKSSEDNENSNPTLRP